MSSLRARLLAAVLAITAVGLLTLAAITYAEQRNFQYDRIDQTARQGARAVAGALAEQGIGEHDIPDHDGDHDGGPPRGASLPVPEIVFGSPTSTLAGIIGEAEMFCP